MAVRGGGVPGIDYIDSTVEVRQDVVDAPAAVDQNVTRHAYEMWADDVTGINLFTAEVLANVVSFYSQTGAADLGTLTDPWGRVIGNTHVWSATTSGALTMNVAASITSHTLTLPGAVGAPNSVLSDLAGTGTLSWSTLAAMGGVTGSGANTQVTFWTGTSTISGDAGLIYDSVNNLLTITQTATTSAQGLLVTDGVSNIQIFMSGSNVAVIRHSHPTGPLRIQTNSTNRWDFAGATGDFVPITTNVQNIGSASIAVATVHARITRSDTGNNHQIQRQDGTAWATLSSGTGQTTLGINTGMNDDTILQFGNVQDVTFRYSSVQTNDGFVVGMGVNSAGQSGNFVFTAAANAGTDHALDVSADPRLYIVSTSGVGNWISIHATSANGIISSATGQQIVIQPAGQNTLIANGAIGGTASAFQQIVSTSGTPTLARFTGAAHTSLDNANFVGVLFDLSANVEFNGGIAQNFARATGVEILAPSFFAAATGLSVDDAATLYISGAPVDGDAEITLTRTYSLWADSGLVRFDGGAEVRDLTSGRVTFATTSGRLTDAAGFAFNSGTTVLTLSSTGSPRLEIQSTAASQIPVLHIIDQGDTWAIEVGRGSVDALTIRDESGGTELARFNASGIIEFSAGDVRLGANLRFDNGQSIRSLTAAANERAVLSTTGGDAIQVGAGVATSWSGGITFAPEATTVATFATGGAITFPAGIVTATLGLEALGVVVGDTALAAPTTARIDVIHATTVPSLHFDFDDATPAVADVIGQIFFKGENSAGADVTYAVIDVRLENVTSGSEVGNIHFFANRNGTAQEMMNIRGDEGVVVNSNSFGFVDFRVAGDTGSHIFFVDVSATEENIAFVTTAAPNFQTMNRGMFIGNVTTAPTGNPSAGGFMWVASGALTYRGLGGTITTIAASDPHCPKCGMDYVHEWRNDRYALSHLAVCVPCMIGALERVGVSRDDYTFGSAA